MNDASDEKLLQALAALKRKYPHWRVGQLVANVAGWADRNIWDAEDAEMLTAAQRHLQQPDRSAEAVA